MFPTRQLDQRAVNLMIISMPITLAARIDYRKDIPDLSYHPDQRSEADILLDSYPLYVEPTIASARPSSEVALKPGRYYHYLHIEILDYLQKEVRTTNATAIATLFGITQHEAAERLYELAALGKLRKIRYRHYGSDNLYTLIDRQLKIEDVLNGKRNDRIIELRNKGYDYITLGQTYNVSSDAIRRLCQSWPGQRHDLLALPVNGAQ